MRLAELKIQENLKAVEQKRQDDLKMAEMKIQMAEQKRQDDLKIAEMKIQEESKRTERKREDEHALARERLDAEREYKSREREAQERLAQLELESRLRRAEENRCGDDFAMYRNAEHIVENSATKRVRDIPNLKQTDRQSIEEYLSNFVRICSMHNIAEGEYCKYLAPKLPPSLSAILVRLPIEKANDFKALEEAIFAQYLLDGDYFRNRFYTLTQDNFESAFEYVRRMRELLGKWLSSEHVEESYEAVLDFLLKNQFMRKLSGDKTVFLKERTPGTLAALCELSDVYDRAHIRRGKPSFNSSGSSGNFENIRTHQNGDREKDNKFGVEPRNWPSKNRFPEQGASFCKWCKRKGHTEDQCRDKIGSQPWQKRSANGPQNSGTHVNAPNGAKIKQQSSSAIKLVSRSDVGVRIVENSKLKNDGNDIINKTREECAGIVAIDLLPISDSAPRLSGCKVVLGDNFTSHTVSGGRLDPCDIAFIGNDPIGYKCLRDTGSWVNVMKSSLVPSENLTGKFVVIQFANGTTEKCATAVMKIKSRFFSGNIEVALLKSPSFDIILGNTPRVNTVFKEQETPTTEDKNREDIIFETPCILSRSDEFNHNDDSLPDGRIHVNEGLKPTEKTLFSDKDRPVYTAVYFKDDVRPSADGSNQNRHDNSIVSMLTRSKAREKIDITIPRLDIMEQLNNISVDEFKRLQKEDSSLSRIWDLIKSGDTRDGLYRDEFFLKNDLLYRRVPKPRGFEEESHTQLVVPRSLRPLVLKTSHESVLGSHMGFKRTADRILECFYWPGCQVEIKRWTQSCDICQKTVKQGSVPRAPMQISKLADYPFQHIAVDLIGELVPASGAGHRYILTIIDLATRYPEAIPLKKIDTTHVANALQSFFYRMGIPDRITSDGGSQFCSDHMEQFFKSMNIKHIRTSPYHAQSNGLVEAYNFCLKKALERLAAERIRDWHLYIEPCLFAYRETPQSSTGFSPNELLFGRTLKGPLQLLRQLLTNETVSPEVKTTYQHVLDLRSRIQETCEIVKQELAKAQGRSKVYFDKKSKDRMLKVGDLVLLMLPTSRNKLELQWRGPYPVTKVIGMCDYQIKMENGKLKTFHVNMLKAYYARQEGGRTEDQVESPVVASGIASVVEEEADCSELSVQDEDLFVHYNTVQKESYLNVEYDPTLSAKQTKQAENLVKEFRDIFSDVPTITNLEEHKIVLTTDTPVRSRPYPVALHMKDILDKEIDSMLEAGIIEPSAAFYASPLVLIKKKDGTLRVAVNYKNLNKISYFDPEPMTGADDIFDRLGGSRFYSKFDLSKGYYQIPLEEQSKDYTTFTSASRGLFRFTVMPFGLASAPMSCTRMMRKLLAGTKQLESYLDDILAHTQTWEEHLSTLREFFGRVRDANLKLKPSKTQIGCKKIDFLGHQVIEDGRTPNPENLNKIMEAARPETKKQVMSWLGLIGFYQVYIPQYSTISAPLTNLLKKNMPNKVSWEPCHEESFQLLKKALLSRPILKLPDIKKPFVLRTDASAYAVAGVVLQEHDGILHPVCFASKKLCERESRWSISDREGLAVVWSILKFKKYLYGASFVVQSDHQPLSILKSSDSTSGRLQRWSLALQPFSFTFEYIKGQDNVGADFFSRHFNFSSSLVPRYQNLQGLQILGGAYVTRCTSSVPSNS